MWEAAIWEVWCGSGPGNGSLEGSSPGSDNLEAAADMIDWGASDVDGWAWTRHGLGRDLSGRFPARRHFSIGIPDVSGRNSGCFVAQSYIPTFLHSYNPTILHSYIPTSLQSYIPSFLQSYIPTILQSYIPTILHSYITHFPLLFPSFLPLSCSLSFSLSLSLSLSIIIIIMISITNLTSNCFRPPFRGMCFTPVLLHRARRLKYAPRFNAPNEALGAVLLIRACNSLYKWRPETFVSN